MRYFHPASLVSIIFLMTPAAYHSIVEEGNDTERFHSFASKMLLTAMALLGIGLSLDIFVVVHVITTSITISLVIAVVTLILCYAMWFGYTNFVDKKKLKREVR